MPTTTAEIVPAKRISAAVRHQLIRAAHARMQRGDGHKGFVGRAYRIAAAHGAIDQWFLFVVVDGGPVIVGNPIDKHARIVGRCTDKGEHLARRWLDGDQCTHTLAKCFFYCGLQMRINREL